MGAYLELLTHAEERHIPLSAVVELTHACDLDCVMCYLDHVPDPSLDALDHEEWRRVFEQLADAGCLFLMLSGGELLLRPDWFELAMCARELGFALRLCTHGGRIGEADADRIASLAPLGVEISVHGARAATHDAVTRRAGSFDRATAAVRMLVARGVPVTMKTLILAINAHEHAEVKALARDLGASSFFDVEVTPMNNGARTPQAHAVSDPALLSDILRDVMDQPSDPAPEWASRHARLDAAPCGAGRRTCHIDPVGQLYPCVQWPHPVGSLREKSFRELWGGAPAFERLRGARLRDLTGCADCGVLDACNPCIALSLLERGDLGGPSGTKCRSALARAEALSVLRTTD